MKESSQTLIFLGAAVASVLAASWSRPTDATYEVDDLIGKPLFTAFETETAKSLRIVRFDEETATLRDFEVAEQNGIWSIPSKGGYPADAESQMAEASTGVIDLEILAIASQDASDHAEYGVIEPSESIEVGQTGVGTRVALQSDKSKALVDIIIGKEVKGAADQHYVRKPAQDVVYVVSVDTEKFSTKFEDWIEDDLLKLNAWDIARVQVKDYSAELVMQGFRPALSLNPRSTLTLNYDDTDSKWTPHELLEFDSDAQDYVPFELTENEALNDDTLSKLKNAVGDLKIVDVERKPKGLSGNLRAGTDFLEDRDSMQSLMTRGFAPVPGESGETEILSSEGEVLITLKDGVEYVLRFGKLQLAESSESNASTQDGEESSGVSRYLFVMARLNDTMIESPEYETVPEAEEAAADDAAEAEEEEEGAADTERDAVIKSNQRLRDSYEQKVAGAQAKVDELNNRFGDWYYVISDEVYKQIAVGRDELIEAKEPAEQEAANEDNTDKPAALSGLPKIPRLEP